jgi:hypothetical protein
VTQELEHLLYKYEALSSNLKSYQKEKLRTDITNVHKNVEEVENL